MKLRVRKTTLERVRGVAQEKPVERVRWGLCRKSRRLKVTECCGNPICDDASAYRPFSYARNSCSRNHERFTLCGFHHGEGHRGDWKTCKRCRKEIAELEMYVYYGTNAYNFETLPNPPAFEPTHCGACGRVIVLSEESYQRGRGGYRCADCFSD